MGLIMREVAPHRPLYVAWESFVTLNEVGVIAVHFADKTRYPLAPQR
jgi:hypothetical protein